MSTIQFGSYQEVVSSSLTEDGFFYLFYLFIPCIYLYCITIFLSFYSITTTIFIILAPATKALLSVAECGIS